MLFSNKASIIESQLLRANEQVQKIINESPLKNNHPNHQSILPFQTYIYPKKSSPQSRITIDQSYYADVQQRIIKKINAQYRQRLFEQTRQQLEQQIYLFEQKKQIKINQIKTLEGIVQEIDRNKQIQKLTNYQRKYINPSSTNQNDANLGNVLTNINSTNSKPTELKNIFKNRSLTSTPCFHIQIDQNQSGRKDIEKKIKKISIPLRLNEIHPNANNDKEKQEDKIYSLRSHGARSYRLLNSKRKDQVFEKNSSNEQNIDSKSKQINIKEKKPKRQDKAISSQIEERLRQVAYYQIEYYKKYQEEVKAALDKLKTQYENKYENYEYRTQIESLGQKSALIRKKLKKLIAEFWQNVSKN